MCSSIADTLQGALPHVNARDVTLGCISRAPLAQAAAACDTVPADFLQEGPGLSAFALDDGVVYQTYQTTARGLEPMMAYYGVLDRTARGRQEGDPPEFWFRRKDEY